MDQKKFEFKDVKLYEQDFLKGAKDFDENSFDIAIADPPYGAFSESSWNLPDNHNMDGFGGKWDITNETWDKLNNGLEGFGFVIKWLSVLKRLVKPSGSLWIHSTYHNSGIVNVACQLLGLEIINEVVWYKRNAFPNLSGRRMTASHETILWVHTGGEKRDYLFNYEKIKAADFPYDHLKKEGKQQRTVWDIPNNKINDELKFGKHPTQKPMRVIERMLLCSAPQNGRLLVPFAGSGSELVAGLKYNLECVGFELESKYVKIACERIENLLKEESLS